MSYPPCPEKSALIALAAELGIEATEMSAVAKAMETANPRAWLLRQGLLSAQATATLSDGAVQFFATGVMAERLRRRRVS